MSVDYQVKPLCESSDHMSKTNPPNERYGNQMLTYFYAYLCLVPKTVSFSEHWSAGDVHQQICKTRIYYGTRFD